MPYFFSAGLSELALLFSEEEELLLFELSLLLSEEEDAGDDPLPLAEFPLELEEDFLA